MVRTKNGQVKHYKMGKVLKANSTVKNQNHETRENNETTWQTRMHRSAVQFASTAVGQAMMMQFFNLLSTLEKSANWISNGKTDGKRGKAPATLIRPLPWVLFLPTLIVLRFTRVILSLISLCFGYNEIEASTMVTFLHDSCRTVRQIVIEAVQNKAHAKHQSSFLENVNQIILSGLSNLSNLISRASNSTHKWQNNKTSLNACSDYESEKNDDHENPSSQDSESEDEIYQRFLTEPISWVDLSEDSDDEDYIVDPNGEDSSDTYSQSSVASDDLSDDGNEETIDEANEIYAKKAHSNSPTNGSPANNDGNYSADTSSYVDQSEKAAKRDSHDEAAQSSTENEVDYTLNRLIDDAATATEARSVHAHNRGKNTNRNNKNGRKHANNQNNGKHVKSKTVKHQHVESTTDFIADESASNRT